MKKLLLGCTLTLSMINLSFCQSNESFFEQYDQFLNTYTKDGGIDFELLKLQPEILNEVYNSIGEIKLEGKSSAYKKAFLINAYNIIVIKQEQVFYPIKSPNEVNGFFDNITHMVAGKEYTLDGLEKQYLLKEFPDPRVHLVLVCLAVWDTLLHHKLTPDVLLDLEKQYLLKEFPDPRVHLVLVCGAKGCPKLLNKAYRPDRLDEQIDEQVTTILNDPEFLIVNKDQSEVALSEIFKWYKDDFANNGSDILDFINRYRTEKLPKESSVSYYAYDWSINTISKED